MHTAGSLVRAGTKVLTAVSERLRRQVHHSLVQGGQGVCLRLPQHTWPPQTTSSDRTPSWQQRRRDHCTIAISRMICKDSSKRCRVFTIRSASHYLDEEVAAVLAA